MIPSTDPDHKDIYQISCTIHVMHDIIHTVYCTMHLLGIALVSSMQQGHHLWVYCIIMGLNSVQVQSVVVYDICRL